MRARLAMCLFVSVLLSGACGGRLVESGSDQGDGGSAQRGGSFSDGATSSAGAPNPGGGRPAAGGTIAVGGSFIAGGAASGGRFPIAGSPSSGGGCACPDIACPPGYVTTPNPDGCCFSCAWPCTNVSCPGVACASGTHLEILPGQCCPTCVQDTCEVQRAGYQALRQSLLETYSTLGCMTNNDCVVYYEKNACNVGCGLVVHSAAVPYLDSNLQGYARSSCRSDCMSPVPPCDAPATPVCVQGQCR